MVFCKTHRNGGMRKIFSLLFVVCLVAGIFGLASWNRGHVQYVAQCEFECRRADNNCDERMSGMMDCWYINELLEAFKRENTSDVLAKTYFQKSLESQKGGISISNAFSSCTFTIKNSGVPKVTLTVYACNSGIAKDVASFIVKSFAEWVENRNRHAVEKNVARLRLELEKARRGGRSVPTTTSALLFEVESRMKREAFRIVPNGEVRCKKVD